VWGALFLSTVASQAFLSTVASQAQSSQIDSVPLKNWALRTVMGKIGSMSGG
jgi:hypothetical protein